MACLSKGLCAPVGSVLASSRERIEEARRARKLLGGGMRQAGVLAAAGLVALDTLVARLADDHANARLLARGARPGKGVRVAPVETNIVVATLEGRTAPDVVAVAARARASSRPPWTRAPCALVTHHDVSREDCERAAAAIERVLGLSAAPCARSRILVAVATSLAAARSARRRRRASRPLRRASPVPPARAAGRSSTAASTRRPGPARRRSARSPRPSPRRARRPARRPRCGSCATTTTSTSASAAFDRDPARHRGHEDGPRRRARGGRPRHGRPRHLRRPPQRLLLRGHPARRAGRGPDLEQQREPQLRLGRDLGRGRPRRRRGLDGGARHPLQDPALQDGDRRPGASTSSATSRAGRRPTAGRRRAATSGSRTSPRRGASRGSPARGRGGASTSGPTSRAARRTGAARVQGRRRRLHERHARTSPPRSP